jgi:acetolactate synthase-1/2/3 large subunit
MGTVKSKSVTKAEFIAEYISQKNVPAVFTLSGGMIAFIVDAIYRLGVTPVIGMRHEQAAGFAAETCTRVSKIPAVALATSGPGATNLITAIASSFFDSVPTIYITGQVNQEEIKKSRFQRQNGFQELNIVEAVRGVTKYAIQIGSNTDLNSVLNEAWETATTGRPGPVLIDIPIDVQQEVYQSTKSENCYENSKKDYGKEIEKLSELIAKHKRPLVLAGGGIVTADMIKDFRKLVEKLNLPVVHTLMAVDILPSTSRYRIGMIGSYGNKEANYALRKSDLLICLGSRLDVRQIGNEIKQFKSNKYIYRVDIDKFELNGRVVAKKNIRVNLKDFISDWLKHCEVSTSNRWIDEIHQYRISNPQQEEQDKGLIWGPNDALLQISKLCKEAEGFIVDVGQHQMWAAQSVELSEQHRFITSGGLGAMGFAVPSAIGACFAKKGNWIVIAGDGCTQLSIAEIQTIKEHNLPIIVFVVNNNQHGMVAQFQETNLENRLVLTREGYSTPDFLNLANAFGIPAFKASTSIELDEISQKLNGKFNGPMLIEITLSNNARALPKNRW